MLSRAENLISFLEERRKGSRRLAPKERILCFAFGSATIGYIDEEIFFAVLPELGFWAVESKEA